MSVAAALHRWQITIGGEAPIYVYADFCVFDRGATVLYVHAAACEDGRRAVAMVTAACRAVDVSAMLSTPAPELRASDAGKAAR